MLFFCNSYVFSDNVSKQKKDIYLNNKKIIYIKNNFKKFNNREQECFFLLKSNYNFFKKHLVNIKNDKYIIFFKKNIMKIFYIVKNKDNLYSISKKLGYKFDQLLKYNNLQKPYKIFVGQKILINNILMTNIDKINGIILKINKNVNTKYILYNNFLNNQLNTINILNESKLFTKMCFYKNTVFLKKNNFKKYWAWPLKNSYMKFFYNYSHDSEGIEVYGFNNQAVFASEKGKVVYVGDFFKSYGKLIIIKHNNYLSMYGFNKYIFVKINEEVHQNQKISTIGGSKNNSSKLYFEIRYKGNSINILNLFPNIKLKKSFNL